ncbi:transcriptional regulator protein [Arthrobacter sp. Hiyo8]|nr:transcriptional regulator protein [Arthrobacter sp. Hiyo8]
MARAALTPLGVAALALLVEAPMHPYEMYQLLMARHEDRLVKVRPGTLYHASAAWKRRVSSSPRALTAPATGPSGPPTESREPAGRR